LSCCSFHYIGCFECCILLMCANRYLLLFSMYLARIQSLFIWLQHAVVFNSFDVHHNQFIESCTSLMWIKRYLLIFSTFLAQFLSHLLTPWCRVLLEKLSGLQFVKKFPCISRNPKVHYRTHKRPPPVSILGQCQSCPYTHIPPPGDPSQYYFRYLFSYLFACRAMFPLETLPPPLEIRLEE